VESVRNGPRALDLDILTYGDGCLDLPDLTIHHPRIAERGLGDVVRTTLQMRGAPAANASTTMPGAASRAGSPDLIVQADNLRRQRKFEEAAEAYRRAAAAGSMNV